MSNEFYLPITLNLASHRPIIVALVVLHAAPILVIATVLNLIPTLLLSAVVGCSLIFYLRQQWLAADATRLSATNAEQWLLYRGRRRYQKVKLIDQHSVGRWVVLLIRQDRRQFRVFVKPEQQIDGQMHRLRVLQTNRRLTTHSH